MSSGGFVLGWLPDAHSLFLKPLLNKAGGENKVKRLMGQDKDREIKYQVPSPAKQTQPGEDACQLLTLKNKIRW